MISLAEALYTAFLQQEVVDDNFVCSNSSDRTDVTISGDFNLQEIADELKDILLEE
jgi:hypothetical protein